MDEQANIVFLLDGSERVTPEVFKEQKDFVKGLAANFNTSPSGPRAAAIVYGTNHHVVSSFEDPDFNQRVDAASLLGTPRRIDSVLEYTAQYLTNRGSGGRKYVILLTAGNQASAAGSKPLSKAMEPLRNIDAETFVVAIGEELSNSQLMSMVDKPQNVVRVAIPTALASKARPIAKTSK